MGQGQRWGRHIEACQDSMCTCLYTTFWEILYTMNIRIKGFLRSRKNGKLKSHTKLINDFLNIYFILFLEREGGREKAGEKHPCEREISIDCLPYPPGPGVSRDPRPRPGIKPTPFGLWDDTPTNWATLARVTTQTLLSQEDGWRQREAGWFIQAEHWWAGLDQTTFLQFGRVASHTTGTTPRFPET